MNVQDILIKACIVGGVLVVIGITEFFSVDWGEKWGPGLGVRWPWMFPNIIPHEKIGKFSFYAGWALVGISLILLLFLNS